ncbi:MAG: DMT family transporter [Candidatus Nanoarchaeia archaeon]|nr:DMT family transporter [Candidatus Nanoarchaeia archaeon]MDD5357810.1 DMT family transporter [Candidatus Nanoarchaeia archaeon]MDD5588729.1 DMT family transporter [Candidatus Nanoarchaeia archaeon]
MVYIPVLGALALGGGTVLEKSILKKKKIGIKLYQTASFLAITLATLPFLYFFWKLDAGAFELKNILIFLGVIASSITANLFVFYSLKWEKVTNLEPARILEPLFTILLAVVFSFFTQGLYEQNLEIIIPAIIASVALIFPHIKKHHLQINKYIIAAILGSFFFALELILSRLILDFYSPMTFYFFRCISIFIISLVVFRPNFKTLDKKISLMIFITGAVWVIYRVALYFGYLSLGVVSTTLVIMLGPIFVYLLAWIFLKEKLNWKNVVSAVIIAGCVLYAILE